VDSASTLCANAGVNAADLTETAARTAEVWGDTGVPARRVGFRFHDQGLNGQGAGRQRYSKESYRQ